MGEARAEGDLAALERACARLVGGDATGTGYLVAERLVATCAHVVRDWPDGKGKVLLGPEQIELAGRVIASDPETDCAIVELASATAARPLPLAVASPRKAVWRGFGFSSALPGAGLAIEGHVADHGSDERGATSLLLYSPSVAEGRASPRCGFSGSPVLVQGAVVGHFKRHLGDPRDHAQNGYVSAAPVAAVRALLGDAEPELRSIDPPKLDSFGDHVPALPAGAFHVFVSYRSTDSAFAKNLVRRLEGAELRVYLAELEMRPGDGIVAGLSHALSNSKAAIAIVSRAWLASAWCQAELKHLLGRAIQDASFRLIPVRIDDAPLPVFLGDCKYIDVDPVAFENATESEKVIDNLRWGLIGTPRPASGSAEDEVGRQELAAARQFAFELKLAANRAETEVLAVWRNWKASGLADVSPALQAAEILIGKARPDLALKVLDDLKQAGLRANQLRGLALAKSEGRRHEAIALFERLRTAGHRDPETTGNLASAYKANFKQTGTTGEAHRAYDLYLESYGHNADAWAGINAATLALGAGMEEQSRDLAEKLVRALDATPEGQRTHWTWATLAQAHLLARRSAKAREYYKRGNAEAGRRVRDIAVMREGARDALQALGQDRHACDDCFCVPTVVAFVGHVTDLPDRPTPRFPVSKVAAVRRQIQQRVERLKPVHTFSSIARGSDIILIQETLKVGGTPHVILPMRAADFKRVSVGDAAWDIRFDELLHNPEVEVVRLSTERPPDDQLPELFRHTNLQIQKRATEYANALFTQPKVIAVWDRRPGDGPGGTADAVESWQQEGYEVDVIDVSQL